MNSCRLIFRFEDPSFGGSVCVQHSVEQATHILETTIEKGLTFAVFQRQGRALSLATNVILGVEATR